MVVCFEVLVFSMVNGEVTTQFKLCRAQIHMETMVHAKNRIALKSPSLFSFNVILIYLVLGLLPTNNR